MTFAQIAALTLLASPLAAVAASPPEARPAAALSRTEQIDVLADFLVPQVMLFALSREQCDTALRTQLGEDPELPALEKALPGMTDRMVKATSAYCDVEMKKVLDARQDQVRTYVAGKFAPADLARLARLFGPFANEARNFRVEAHPGDTMKQIIARIPDTAESDQRLRTAQMAFARTQGAVDLLNALSDYRRTLQHQLAQDQKALVDIAAKSYPLARRAANVYAREKGMLPFYAEEAGTAPTAQAGAAQAPVVAATEPRPASLPGSVLYIYSFLDVREDEYTPKVLDQFDGDLTARLAALNISSKILRYNDSVKAKGKEEFVAGVTNQGGETRSIPVSETIARNFIPERTSGARFRLVIFPANFTLAGVWRFYDIRFILMDAADGKSLWEYVYSGKHMVMLRDSENAVARSKKILDHAFAEMKAKGLL